MPSLFRLGVLKLFRRVFKYLMTISPPPTTPRAVLFSFSGWSAITYEVNMAIASWSPFLSIRKSKYQRDIASKMKQLCYLIRTSHSSRSLGGTGYFLESTRRIRTLVVAFELLEEMVASGWRNGKFNKQFQIFSLELKLKFIRIAFVCISDGFRSTWLIYISYATCWQVPQNGAQTWRKLAEN